MSIRGVCALACALALAGGFAAAHAAPGGVGDLLAVCNDALQANARYRAARAELAAARELVPQAAGKLHPQLGARAQYDWVNEDIEGDYYGIFDIDRDDSFERFLYGVQLQQALYRPELTIGRSQAGLRLRQAEHALQGAQDALLLEVAEAYFGVLAAEDAAAFARAEAAAVGEQLEQVSVRERAGLATDADTKAALAQHELAVASHNEALDAVANATTRLEALTGRRYRDFKRLPLNLLLIPPQPADENAWIERAESANLLVQVQRLAAEIARLDHDKARKLAWPTVDIVAAAYALDSGGGVSGERDETEERIGVVLNLPIYTGGQIGATRRQMRSLEERAQALLDDALVQAVRDTRIAYRNSSSGLQRVSALKRAVDAAIAAEEAMRAGFDAGTRTSTDVLQSVERRFAAERDHAAARYRFLMSSLRLKQLSGNLLVADLAQINRMLEAPPPSTP